MWIEPNVKTNDYRIEYIYKEGTKDHIVGSRTVFSKRFLRERHRVYNPRTNKYENNPVFNKE